MKRWNGFTLIELMVTVVAVAILAALVLPSFSQYVLRARIPPATSVLASMQTNMEKFFQDNRTYVGACAANTVAPLPASTADGTFLFACPVLTATGYQITATGTGPMLGFSYSIDQSGLKTTTSLPSGWTLGTCGWVIRKDGSC